MAIQSNIPFQLTLISGPDWNQRRLPISRFYDQARLDGLIEPGVVIKENTELAIAFTSADPRARFYMDGLETLPQGRLAEDSSGRSYLLPSQQPILLFSYINYPLIPGYYWLEVVLAGQHYFAPLLVEPKRLTRAQWEVMRKELGSELYQLAFDLICQRSDTGEACPGALPPELLHRFIVIRRHFLAVMAAINDLLSRANYQVGKTYQLRSCQRAPALDQKSIRNQLTRPDARKRLATPVPIFDYDLPENRWVKHILRVVSRCLSDFCDAIVAHTAQVGLESTDAHSREQAKLLTVLQSYEASARKMNKAIGLLRRAPWYAQVGETLPTQYPAALTSDTRYNALYGLYRQLRCEAIDGDSDDNYSWKRTDQLYELWCFLKLYRALVDPQLGFQPKGGWLLDDADSSTIIPAFDSGSGINLARASDQVTLHLVYDQELPKQSQETDQQCLPLFTRGINNRPDGRLDIYTQNTYVGSIIFEFKYRPLHAFWDINAISGAMRPKAMNQLISYANDIRSPHLHAPQLDQRWRLSISPIHEVWAVFPGTDNGNWHNELHEDHSVRLISLAPDTELDGFVNVLADSITTALARMK